MPGQGRDDNGRPFSNLMVSRDHGATWAVSNPASGGTSECQAVQLNDGSIMLNMRTEQPTKYRSVYVTHDLGKTWRPHGTNRRVLIEPNCNGSLVRFDYREDGRSKSILLFANPHSQTGRDHQTIQVSFDDGQSFPLRAELLRVESPSAEVQGHGPGQKQIVAGRRHVGIIGLEPVGNYAVRIRFDDLHETGIYSWDYLYDLGLRQDELWQAYLAALEAQGLSRDP